eukprot:scaffold319995_cov37-Tisochrysis_lutea.AAC.1
MVFRPSYLRPTISAIEQVRGIDLAATDWGYNFADRCAYGMRASAAKSPAEADAFLRMKSDCSRTGQMCSLNKALQSRVLCRPLGARRLRRRCDWEGARASCRSRACVPKRRAPASLSGWPSRASRNGPRLPARNARANQPSGVFTTLELKAS